MRNPIFQPSRYRAPIGATLVVLWGMISGVPAQTPWAAAPARPAALPLPAANNSATSPRVVSLSPPAGPGPSISTPAYVPLSQAPSVQAPSVQTSVPGQVPGASPVAGLPPFPTSTGGGSVNAPVANTFTLPNAVGATPVGVTPSLSSAGVPTGRLVAYGSEEAAQVEAEQISSGELIAVVGSSHVLFGDMAGFVEPIIESNRDKIPNKQAEEQLRLKLTRQVLKQYVEIKAMYLEFFRDMAGTGSPQELQKMEKEVSTRAGKIFFEKQVPTMLKKYQVSDIGDLERKLDEKAMSLSMLRRQFVEQVLGAELENKYIPKSYEISREELLAYYQEHQTDWNVEPRAKWQQLTIRFDRHDRQSAEALIKGLGNEVFLGGKPFEAVAKQSSEGFTADKGGAYDWTTMGSLKSAKIDNAIFTLPVGELSQVIEDEIGLHIIRVTEREDGHTKSFADAQPEIREAITEKKRQKDVEELRAKILARTPVWSRWPEDLENIAHARPLSDVLGD
ncbi:peptidylprolyl isomerase [Aureliella helgolandensis]|uniref:Periplasmic chaperone PpiD n=1 Tax=Aureliella helgolandensis TaxID=2527968 RepID=A0A518GA05_9BACT|nr:peptidylprolyl isomerase [Aureliella helgolandensis]QDV25399.1 peptidylprolyl isomerase [Aureliella helgolandensis]